MVLTHCILGKFFGVVFHCIPPPLEVPTFSARCLYVQRRERPPATEGGNLRGRKIFPKISSKIRLPHNPRDLSHAANLRHGTGGFTFFPKEGVLRIFSPLKIRRLRPGLNPWTWVPKASTLPLDHRSRQQRNILREIRKGKANWIGQILRRNCLLQRVTEGKIQGGIEVTGRQGRRRRKLLDDLKERRGYSHLKEEALDRTMWRAGFGRGFGPVVRQSTKWMN
jgi:hypothetical protein